MQHPQWSNNAAIYQINTRQFTPEGTFRAARAQLPRLKELGVDIVWVMPVHEIGVKNRKGTLGSPYSVKDYYSINPEFGTLQDLKDFVNDAHELGLYVILDWVANHTAWDSVLVDEHPEWYARDYKGDFRPTPWWDWTDIIDLDYRHDDLRRYMIDAMCYWIREVDIDGYRCDVAGYVPTDFWEDARREMDEIKPVFMLAEWEARDMHRAAFDATFAWSWNQSLHELCHGKADVAALYVYYSWNECAWPRDAMRMTFVSNHDKNAWDGTMYEQFGKGLHAAIVLSVVGEGIPLIYNGQEAGNGRRLQFFERDPIQWRPDPIGELYKKLFALQHEHEALWHGAWGARMIRVPNDDESKVLSFVRQQNGDKVLAVFNFSGESRGVRMEESLYHGGYVDYFTGREVRLDEGEELPIEAWGYRVFTASDPS